MGTRLARTLSAAPQLGDVLRQPNGDPNSELARLQSNALKWGLVAIDGKEASEVGLSDGGLPPARVIAVRF